jgi:hypothetical protein
LAAAAIAVALTGASCDKASDPTAANERRAHPAPGDRQDNASVRRALLEALTPVTLKNCVMKRFGSAHDGGYVMCENLLQDVRTAYSYGIGGNDEWGCDVSTRLAVPVHQYDCFEPPQESCPTGRFVAHDECVGPAPERRDGRAFDTMAHHVSRNRDEGKRLLVKIDIEGAEWQSLLATPDEVLAAIDQLPMELHGTGDPLFLEVVEKLKRNFYPVHLHFNNWACRPDVAPFPAAAYQVLFVNKRVGIPGTPASGNGSGREFDAPDNPKGPDCQLPPAN